MKKSKGFTLVELMVVLVIIGILATMAIPKFFGATDKTKATECKPVLKEIYTLQEAYSMENSGYAANATAIGFTGPTSTNARFTYGVSYTTVNGELGWALAGTAADWKLTGMDGSQKACIDANSDITAETPLHGLLKATVGTCY